ncbi:MAG: exo-alpha-sialidase, partial [Euryarchaeota archaeon]|nr:exo-alpha-sialidase [Euryarchaeota archaeon]
LAVNGSVVMVAGSASSSTLVSASQNGGANWTEVGSATGASPRLALSQNGTLLSTLQGGQAYATVFGLTNQTTAPVPLGPALNATPIWNPVFMGVLVSGTFSATTWDQKSVQVSGVACFTSADGGASFSQHAPATYQSIARNLSLASVDPIFNSIGQTSLGYPGGEPGQLGALSQGGQVMTVFTSSENGEVLPVVATSSDGCSHWTSTTPAPPPSGGSVMDPQVVEGPDGNVYLAWRDDGLGGWTEDLATFSLSGHTISSPLRLPGSQDRTAEAPALTVDPFNRPVLVWATNTSTVSSGWMSGGFLSPAAIQQAWTQQVDQLQTADMVHLSSSNLTALRQDLLQLGNDLSNGSVTAAAQQVAVVYPRVTNGTLLLANSTLCPLVGGGCANIVPPAVPLWVLNLTGVLAPDQYFEDYADLEFEALGLAVLSPPPGDPVVGFPPPPPPPPSGGGPGSSGGGPITVSGATSVSASETFINPITGELAISWTFPGYSQGHTYTFNGAACPAGSPPHGSKVTDGWTNLSTASIFAVGVSSGAGTQTFVTSAPSINIYLTNLPEGTSTGWSVSIKASYS